MSGKELMVDGKPLSTLRVVDLKDELEKRGLSKSGSKKDLAERLKVHLQIEKQRQGASRDEEQLPNISMQEKLAEQNPFIRDYFASQAELYHSQKVVKKLYEEETRKESEASSASADEGCDSPVKEKRIISSSERSKVRKLVQHFEVQSKEKLEEKPQSSRPEDTPVDRSERRLTRIRSTEISKSTSAKEVERTPTEKSHIAVKSLPPQISLEELEKARASEDMRLRSKEKLAEELSGQSEPLKTLSKKVSEANEDKGLAANIVKDSPKDLSKSSPIKKRRRSSEKLSIEESSLTSEAAQRSPRKITRKNSNVEVLEKITQVKDAVIHDDSLKTEKSHNNKQGSQTVQSVTVDKNVSNQIVDKPLVADPIIAVKTQPTLEKSTDKAIEPCTIEDKPPPPKPLNESNEIASKKSLPAETSAPPDTQGQATEVVPPQQASPEKSKANDDDKKGYSKNEPSEKLADEKEVTSKSEKGDVPAQPLSTQASAEIPIEGINLTVLKKRGVSQDPIHPSNKSRDKSPDVSQDSSSKRTEKNSEVCKEPVVKSTDETSAISQAKSSESTETRRRRRFTLEPTTTSIPEIDTSKQKSPNANKEKDKSIFETAKKPEKDAESLTVDEPIVGIDVQKSSPEKHSHRRSRSPVKVSQEDLKGKASTNVQQLEKSATIAVKSAEPTGEGAVSKEEGQNEKSEQIANEKRSPKHSSKIPTEEASRPKRKRSSSTPEKVKPTLPDDSEDKDENDKAELELHVNTTEMDIDVDEPPPAVKGFSKLAKIKTAAAETSKLNERSRRFQLSRDKFQPPKKQEKSESSSSPESRSPSVVTSRQVSVRTEEMDEEALDYGDEEKSKSEPEKFTWSGRIMRLKSKQISRNKERKWRKDTTKKIITVMDNDYYQKLYTEVKPVAISELKLEDKSPARVERKIEIIRKVSLDVEDNELPLPPIVVDNKQSIRKVSIVPLIDDSEREPTPPRNPPTQLIVVTNLVRPFTLPGLKDMLQRTGTIVDMWVDKIKSKCIAKFETEAQALETRSVLHGIKWPNTTSKPLHVDFSTQESFDEHKAKEIGEVKPIVEKPDVAQNHPVREWDMGKRSRSRSPNRIKRRSRSTSRDRKRGRRSHSPHRRRHSRTPTQDKKGLGTDKETEPIGKALDELFRKTVATPSIYWLPLTPQQIAEKEDLRRRRMQERERRLAELNKLRPPR